MSECNLLQKKHIDGCWQCAKVKECNIGFFSSGENDAKACALYIKKYDTEKYTKTILELINRGYNYQREFKALNDITKILEIFESEK